MSVSERSGTSVITAPNAVSLTRVPVGVLLARAARVGDGRRAFGLFTAGLATDWLDGELASRLGGASDLGRDVLEPVCDLVLVASATYALVKTEVISARPVVAVTALAGVGQTVIFTVDESHLLRRVANGAMPLGYVAAAAALWYGHAHLAFGDAAKFAAIPGAAVGIAIGFMKRGRLSAWLHGRAF